MNAKSAKMRLDELVVQRGWCETRSQAKAIILAGKIRRGSHILDKPGKVYRTDTAIGIIEPPRFVSRGGEKLEGFLSAYSIPITETYCLDVGASTGGFTDCLLQRGAKSVVCIDVGRAQLHSKLKADKRVQNLEGLNARYLSPEQLPFPSYSIVVMDLSFISLQKVLPAIWPLLKKNGFLIMLIKPQFEADKRTVDAGRGVIRNPSIHQAVVKQIRLFCIKELVPSQEIGCMESPLLGTAGNKEYLLGLQKKL